MQVIGGGRQSGKTTQLIQFAANNNGYIVCQSKPEAARIAAQARNMEVNINFPITYQEFIERRYNGKGVSKFHIDNADYLLQSLTEVPIANITVNVETRGDADDYEPDSPE